jgi:hypothetical protein
MKLKKIMILERILYLIVWSLEFLFKYLCFLSRQLSKFEITSSNFWNFKGFVLSEKCSSISYSIKIW